AISGPLFRELAADREHFQGLAAEQAGAEEIPVGVEQPHTDGGVGERASVKVVTANYFDVLGVKAALGRTFLSGDETGPGADPVLVLSHAYWQRRFGGNPAIAGQRLHLAGRSYTVVGVAARGFDGTQLGTTVDLWAPLTMQPALTGKSSRLESHQRWWLV